MGGYLEIVELHDLFGEIHNGVATKVKDLQFFELLDFLIKTGDPVIGQIENL